LGCCSLQNLVVQGLKFILVSITPRWQALPTMKIELKDLPFIKIMKSIFLKYYYNFKIMSHPSSLSSDIFRNLILWFRWDFAKQKTVNFEFNFGRHGRTVEKTTQSIQIVLFFILSCPWGWFVTNHCKDIGICTGFLLQGGVWNLGKSRYVICGRPQSENIGRKTIKQKALNRKQH
jgi:hypothetical protein